MFWAEDIELGRFSLIFLHVRGYQNILLFKLAFLSSQNSTLKVFSSIQQEYVWPNMHLGLLTPTGDIVASQMSGKKHACQRRRLQRRGLIPELGRSPGEGNDNPLQYSCLENPMDRGAWWAMVHRVTKSLTWWKWLGTHRGNQWVWMLWIWHDSTTKSTLEPVPSPGTQKIVN